MIVRIDHWQVECNQTGYTAPEAVRYWLCGYISEHPDYQRTGPRNWTEPRPVSTSNIVSAKGRHVTTNSGTVYVLGNIDPGYRRWLRKHKPGWNWRKPFGK